MTANRDEIERRLIVQLGERPGQYAKQLADRIGVPKSRVNSVLYARQATFEAEGPQPPRWYLRLGVTASASVTVSTPHQSNTTGLSYRLRAWQSEALEAWSANAERGIVQAVTGTGKTKVGVAAISAELRRGGRAAVIVPGRELQRQWAAELAEEFPDKRIGLLGDGRQDSLASSDVLVAIVNSARVHALGLPAGVHGLLVADERHRYGVETNAAALEDAFGSRLGLSAIYERGDGGHRLVLEPYFGPLVFDMGYRRAHGDGLIAPVRLAQIGVDFTSSEQHDYDRASEEASKARHRLITAHQVPPDPFSHFIERVTYLKNHGTMREGMDAGRFLSAWSRKREILSSTGSKFAAATQLVPSFRDADRSLVFTNSTTTAERLARQLGQHGLSAAAHHSGVDGRTRRELLDRFRTSKIRVLVSPMTLNEGIDVPEADLAVVLAGSRTEREMVQRMGRIVRIKADGRAARFAVVYVKGTSEDPSSGAHESFIDKITEIAERTERFDLRTEARALRTFLSP